MVLQSAKPEGHTHHDMFNVLEAWFFIKQCKRHLPAASSRLNCLLGDLSQPPSSRHCPTDKAGARGLGGRGAPTTTGFRGCCSVAGGRRLGRGERAAASFETAMVCGGGRSGWHWCSARIHSTSSDWAMFSLSLGHCLSQTSRHAPGARPCLCQGAAG